VNKKRFDCPRNSLGTEVIGGEGEKKMPGVEITSSDQKKQKRKNRRRRQ